MMTRQISSSSFAFRRREGIKTERPVATSVAGNLDSSASVFSRNVVFSAALQLCPSGHNLILCTDRSTAPGLDSTKHIVQIGGHNVGAEGKIL